jgi:L-amino acid N-acyltransferase YncA
MMSIRRATSADITEMTSIYEHAVLHGTGSYELDPPDEKELGRRFAHFTGNGFPWLVYEDRGMVLGYAYASPFRTRPAYRWMIEDSVYVAPEAKGKGIGKTLLSALIEECRRLGYHQIVAVIGDGQGNKGSVALHESLNFEHSGTIKGSGFKHGRWVDTVIMQLALNGGDGELPDQTRFPAGDWKGL